MDMNHQTNASSAPDGPDAQADSNDTALPSRRSVLKATWIVPAIMALGSIPAMGASQSPGGPGGVQPRRMPPEPA